MKTFSRSALPLLAACAALLPLAACSEGGSTKTSDVKLAAMHWGVGFGGTFEFTQWPLDGNDVTDDFFTLDMRDDGNYVVDRVGQAASTPFPYFLQEDGLLGLRVPLNNGATTIWDGAYAIANPSSEYVFVRRDANPTFYAGIAKLSGEPALQGDWWAFGTELHFGDANKTPSSDTIGRAFAGSLSFDASKTVSSGTWTDSSTTTGQTVLVTGAAQSYSDGEVQLTVGLVGGAATGARSFEGGFGKHFGAMASRNSSEPAQSLMLMCRKHNANWALTDLAGDWWVATQTIFNNPAQDGNGALTNAGLDAALGTLTIEADGDVRIRVRGISSRDFLYSGTIRTGPNGSFEIEINGQDRRWQGAMDPDKKVLVFADNVTRSTDRNLDWEIGVYLAVPVQVPSGN
jgi:hypothetical protein